MFISIKKGLLKERFDSLDVRYFVLQTGLTFKSELEFNNSIAAFLFQAYTSPLKVIRRQNLN